MKQLKSVESGAAIKVEKISQGPSQFSELNGGLRAISDSVHG